MVNNNSAVLETGLGLELDEFHIYYRCVHVKHSRIFIFDIQYSPEHMEEDEPSNPNAIPPWVGLEYAVRSLPSTICGPFSCLNAVPFVQHMRKMASPDSQLHFAHLSKSSCDCLANAFKTSHTAAPSDSQLAPVFCHRVGVMELIEQRLLDVTIDEVCLLDPKAETALSPQDGNGRFKCFLFGVSGFGKMFTVSFLV